MTQESARSFASLDLAFSFALVTLLLFLNPSGMPLRSQMSSSSRKPRGEGYTA
jgi:hypothetical protein